MFFEVGSYKVHIEPPYPYALAQLGGRAGEIQCEAQLLDERFTLNKNVT